jgi:N-acetylglutamate synthase-like GNAT family acetyltransferase
MKERLTMEIVDLTSQNLDIYCCCLEDWNAEVKEAGDHKKNWYKKMKSKGLRVKLAVQDNKVCGMIQYIPARWAFIEGQDIYFILCIWVHGHKQGIGNQQKKGMGTALLQAAEEDVRALKAKGLVAWGLSLPFWMKASWFKKHSFRKVDKDGMAVLLWKPFSDDAVPPKWIKEKKRPGKATDKVVITAFKNGWCTAQNLTFERAQRMAKEFDDRVEFREIDTLERTTYLEWGISDAVFINEKQVRSGPPPSAEKIRKKIAKKVKSVPIKVIDP